MGQFITYAEVPGFTAADDWRITDAEAMALLAAPCLSGDLDNRQTAAVRAVLRQALMRWKEVGSGAVTQQQVGPFGQSVDTSSVRRGMFWPSELDQLRAICNGTGGATSGTATTVSSTYALSLHLPWCSLNLGALYCSCGVDIAGEPIFEA